MNQRIFVEKKSAFDVESQKVLAELQEFTALLLASKTIRYLRRVWSCAREYLGKTTNGASRMRWQTRSTLRSNPAMAEGQQLAFAMEYLPGQYDQRADSAEQAIQLVT